MFCSIYNICLQRTLVANIDIVTVLYCFTAENSSPLAFGIYIIIFMNLVYNLSMYHLFVYYNKFSISNLYIKTYLKMFIT